MERLKFLLCLSWAWWLLFFHMRPKLSLTKNKCADADKWMKSIIDLCWEKYQNTRGQSAEGVCHRRDGFWICWNRNDSIARAYVNNFVYPGWSRDCTASILIKKLRPPRCENWLSAIKLTKRSAPNIQPAAGQIKSSCPGRNRNLILPRRKYQAAHININFMLWNCFLLKKAAKRKSYDLRSGWFS